MLACGGVDALVLEDETGYGDVIQDVRLDDFSNIFGLHLAVPHCFGIDDHRGPMLTLIEAAGFVGAYRALQTTIGKCGLEELLQVASGTLRATSAGAPRLTLVRTDEDVLSKFRHVRIVSMEWICPLRDRRERSRVAGCSARSKHLKTNLFVDHRDRILPSGNHAGAAKFVYAS